MVVQELILFIRENPHPNRELFEEEQKAIDHYTTSISKFCKRSNHPAYKFINSVMKALREFLRGNDGKYLAMMMTAIETEWNGKVLMHGFKLMLLNRMFMVKKRMKDLILTDSEAWLSLIPVEYRGERCTLEDAIEFFKEKESHWELRLLKQG